MPVGALLAPFLASVIAPELAGTLGGLALEGGLGAALGAGSGAAFGALTGEGAGKGAEAGAIGGAAGPLGGALGEAAGIGETAGTVIGGAAGGAAGAGITGSNPLIGAAEGAAAPAISAVSGGFSGPSATVTPSSPSTGASGAVGAASSLGAGSAAAGSSIPLDPTGGSPAAGSGGGTVSAGGGVASNGLSGSTDFLLPGTDTPVSGGTPGGTIDAGSGGLQSLLDRFTSNPGLLLQAAPLALSLFGGGQSPYPAEKSLNTLATNLGTQGQSLTGYVQSGTLPPGAQQNVDLAKKAGEAAVRSAAARTGTAGSTMEAQNLAGVDQAAAGQQFLLADRLLGEGINAEGAAGNIYSSTLRAEMTRDQQFQQALTTFASGLARGGTPYPTNYGG